MKWKQINFQVQKRPAGASPHFFFQRYLNQVRASSGSFKVQKEFLSDYFF